MNRLLLIALFLLAPAGAAFADGGHQHGHAPASTPGGAPAVPTLKNQVTTRIAITDDTVTLTFGPIDLPSPHEGDLAASLPKHVFRLPEDRFMTGYKSEVFTAEGKQLPQNYLHHILMLDNDQPSVSCDGEPLFFAGAGLEMTEARFPEGYGVKLDKTHHLMSVVAFYHKAPPTKNVMARFTMYTARKGKPVKDMAVYQVGINIVCYSKFSQRGPDQTDEGIEIKPGVTVHSAPLKFNMDGCVKFAYPHGHDELLLITLDNKTKKQTLLRTVPDVGIDGTFMAFQPHQVYKDATGFPVTKQDDYEMTMVHHHPIHNPNVQHGMGNYLLYMTPGECPPSKMASSKE